MRKRTLFRHTNLLSDQKDTVEQVLPSLKHANTIIDFLKSWNNSKPLVSFGRHNSTGKDLMFCTISKCVMCLIYVHLPSNSETLEIPFWWTLMRPQ